MNQQISCLRCGRLCEVTVINTEDGQPADALADLAVEMTEPGVMLTVICGDCLADDRPLQLKFYRMSIAQTLTEAEQSLEVMRRLAKTLPAMKDHQEFKEDIAYTEARIDKFRKVLDALLAEDEDGEET